MKNNCSDCDHNYKDLLHGNRICKNCQEIEKEVKDPLEEAKRILERVLRQLAPEDRAIIKTLGEG